MSSAIVLSLLNKLDKRMQSTPSSLSKLSDFEDWGRSFVRLWGKLIENGVDVDEAPLQSCLTDARRAFSNIKEVAWLDWCSVLLPHLFDTESKDTRTEDRKRRLDEAILLYIEDVISIAELHELEAKIGREEEEDAQMVLDKEETDAGISESMTEVLDLPADAFDLGDEYWKFDEGKANDTPGEALFEISKEKWSNKDSEEKNIKGEVGEKQGLGPSSKRKREVSEEVGELAEEREQGVGEGDTSSRSDETPQVPELETIFVARACREPSNTSGRVVSPDSGFRSVSGPCDRCAGSRQPQDCTFDDNDPRCVRCQRHKKGCFWGGISRSGKEDPEAKRKNRANAKGGEEAGPSERPLRSATRAKADAERIVFAGKTPPRLQGARNRDLEPARKKVRVEEPVKSWTDLRAELEVATEELIRSNARLRLIEDHSSVLRTHIEKLGEQLVDLQESEGDSEDDGE